MGTVRARARVRVKVRGWQRLLELLGRDVAAAVLVAVHEALAHVLRHRLVDLVPG
tara:strand:+ start:784 stop:948 length:165 start_codon:yes stop_codon:yes gene_type:complete